MKKLYFEGTDFGPLYTNMNNTNYHFNLFILSLEEANIDLESLRVSESISSSCSNKLEVNKSNMNGNEDKEKKQRKKLSLVIRKKGDVLAEFAELSTNEELRKIHENRVSNNVQAPLSGSKLIRLFDDSSPYLKCSKFFSESSPSGLIPALEKDQEKKDNPQKIKYMMSSVVEDTSVWPYVWTCFGRSCKIQYSKDLFYGPLISLDDLNLIDNDEHLQIFQRLWKADSKLLVVDITPLSTSHAKIKICSALAADKHAGHLNVTVQTNHPFYVENKGWCQINPKHAFFKTLMKMDIITNIEEDSSFLFDDDKNYQNEKSINIQSKIKLKKKQEKKTSPNISTFPNEQIPAFMKRPEMQMMGHFPTMPAYPQFSNHSVPFMQESMQMMGQIYDPQSFRRFQSEIDQDHESKGTSLDIETRKRPMNGFMLFARTMRLQLINENPGKDNRVISKLLGEKWKELTEFEKKKYIEEAKSISERRLKINPLCWKRKNNPKKVRKGAYLRPFEDQEEVPFFYEPPKYFPDIKDKYFNQNNPL